MLSQSGLILSLIEHINARSISVACLLVSGLASNLCFVLFLPDSDLLVVIGAMAISGLISGTAVSNCTAKLYATINAAPGERYLVNLTLLLYVFELIMAQLLVFVAVLFEHLLPNDFTWFQLSLLAMAASSGSLIAFAKFENRLFVWINIVRTVSTIGRLGLIFLLIEWGEEILILPVIIASLAVPSLFALGATIAIWRRCSQNDQASSIRFTQVLGEYLWGVPVAMSRASINQGLLVVAVALLSPGELRMFRFLLLPKDVIGRLFNAALPLIFDRMYMYQPNWLRLGAIGLSAMLAALIWYGLGVFLFAFDWSAIAAFALFMSLNLTVYSVLPIVWRTIYRNKASHNTTVVLTSISLFGGLFWLIRPQSVNAIFLLICAYLLCYIMGTLQMARIQRTDVAA